MENKTANETSAAEVSANSDETVLTSSDVLVEEVSIDGMCGVY